MSKRPGKALTAVEGPWSPLTYGETLRIRTLIPHYVGGWSKRVAGGYLRAFLSEDRPGGWHLSVAFTASSGQRPRYPTWDEIASARYELAPTSCEFVMFLPPPEDYVNLHDTTFHLHEYPARGEPF